MVATLLWWLPLGAYSTTYMHAWVVCAVLTYFAIETVAANAMLRVRSQMPAVLMLVLMAACGFLHDQPLPMLAAVAVAIATHCLLRSAAPTSADDSPSRTARRPQMETFHAFAALSLGSLLWPPMLLLALPMLWSQTVYLRSMSWRCLGAAVIGMATPYFFWGIAALATDSLAAFTAHTSAIIRPVAEPIADIAAGRMPLADTYASWLPAAGATDQAAGTPDVTATVAANARTWAAANAPRLAATAVTVLLALTGFVHYSRRSYDDKISVRICHQTFMSIQACATLWLALQPQHFLWLLPIVIVTAAPAAGHFVALTHTWLTNAWALTLGLLLIVAAVLNLVPSSADVMAGIPALFQGSLSDAADALRPLLEAVGIGQGAGS